MSVMINDIIENNEWSQEESFLDKWAFAQTLETSEKVVIQI